MRDESQEQSQGTDALAAQHNNTDGVNESERREAPGYDSPANRPERWVPLAYDLEQNGDSGSEHRGEVF